MLVECRDMGTQLHLLGRKVFIQSNMSRFLKHVNEWNMQKLTYFYSTALGIQMNTNIFEAVRHKIRKYAWEDLL